MLQKTIASQLDCFHCGLPVMTGEQFCAEFDGELQYFCCPGCRAVAETIKASGLSSFYQYRSASDSAQIPDFVLSDDDFSAFDEQEFLQRFTQNKKINGVDVSTIQLLLGGIHCAACIWLIEHFLLKLDGVEQVVLSLSEHSARVTWRQDKLALSDICRALASLGYSPEPYSADHVRDMQLRENHLALRRLGVAGIGMMQVGMFAIALYAGALQSMDVEYRDFMRWVSLIVTTPVVFYAAKPFFVGAWRGLKFNTPGMDLPVAIAIGLAFAASVKATLLSTGEVYFDSVAMFTFLLLGGRYLEMRARHYAGRTSRDLNSLLPATALRLREDDTTEAVALFKLNVGDRLLLKPGQVIAADGIVVAGSSSVDESQMTGEFKLQDKNEGDNLVAGTINSTGVLTMQVQATGADLQLQSINLLLAKGLAEKPDIARLADRLSSYFVLLVIFVAVATYTYWQFFAAGDTHHQGFWVMLSVLVVSCPCALSLATPAALTAATNRLRRLGLLVTKPQVWEAIPTITDVVCDKTGTLTKGEFSIAEIRVVTSASADHAESLNVATDKEDEAHYVAIAAALERCSEHPIAKAFTRVDRQLISPAEVTEIEIVHGMGVEGVIAGCRYRLGCSQFAAELYQHDRQTEKIVSPDETITQWLLLSNMSGPLCWFSLEDPLREDAADLVAGLQARKLRVHLLSGDNSVMAQYLAEKLSIEHCVSGATPQQKLAYIHSLQQSGAKVLMLGDGINDVPVLAAADVSVAMANASTLAKTHADSILLSGRLSGVLELLKLALNTRSIIKQNLSWALGYNLTAIPLAAMGMVPPYVAAIGMSLSSIVVVLNALRLQRASKMTEADRSVQSVPEYLAHG
ncbi:MAG: heavy metal translocating P-type ATPase [Spongiibacteraceae bacterium]